MVAEAVAAAPQLPAAQDGVLRVVTLRGRRVLLLDVLAWAVVTVGGALQAVAMTAAGPTFEDVARQAATGRRGLLDVLADPAALPGTGAAGGILTRAAVWMLATAAPLRDLPVVTVADGLRALLAAGVWLLLRRLLRPSAALLGPLAVVVAAPPLLVTGAGAVPAFGPLAAATALVWALVAHVWWSGARRLVAVAAATALAVGTDRTGVLVPVVLATLSLTVAAGSTGAGRRRAVDRWSAAVAGSAAVAALAVAVPVLRPVDLPQVLDGSDPDVVGRVLAASWAGLVGAPWRWAAGTAGVRGVPAVPAAAAAAGLAVVLVVLVLAVRRDRGRALRAVALGAVWGTGAVVLGAPGRPAATAALLGVTVATVVAAALAVLPRSGPDAGPQRDRTRPTGSTDHTPASGGSPRWRRAGRRVRPGVVLALPVVVLAAAVPSTDAFATAAAANPVRGWVAAVRTTLHDLQPFPRVSARSVPRVVAGPGYPGTLDSDVVTLLRPDALVHDADGQTLTLDDRGDVMTARFERLGGSTRAPLCAAAVQPGDTREARVALNRAVRPTPDAQVRLEVLVTGTARLRVAVEDADGRTTPVRRWSDDLLYEGPHTLLLPMTPHEGAVVAVRVRPELPDAGVCVVVVDLVRTA